MKKIRWILWNIYAIFILLIRAIFVFLLLKPDYLFSVIWGQDYFFLEKSGPDYFFPKKTEPPPRISNGSPLSMATTWGLHTILTNCRTLYVFRQDGYSALFKRYTRRNCFELVLTCIQYVQIIIEFLSYLLLCIIYRPEVPKYTEHVFFRRCRDVKLNFILCT